MEQALALSLPIYPSPHLPIRPSYFQHSQPPRYPSPCPSTDTGVIALQPEPVATTPAPELEDVRAAVGGDAAAFERLYRRHAMKVHALARWMAGADDAEEAVQDVFVRVWQKLEQFEGRSAFGTWVHRIAVTVLLRRRQQRGLRDQRHSGEESEVAALTARPATPDLRVAIEAAVDRLPGGAREVFVLHDMEGYRHEEVAQLLGCTSGTSRSQLHRARMLLREFLD